MVKSYLYSHVRAVPENTTRQMCAGWYRHDINIAGLVTTDILAKTEED